MGYFQPTVEDLALFFCNDQGTLGATWVPHTVYLKTKLGAPKAEWQATTVYEEKVGAKDVAFVVNLSNLIGPGVPPQPVMAAKALRAAPAKAKVSKNDLVVIPPGSPDTAYLVTRATYQD